MFRQILKIYLNKKILYLFLFLSFFVLTYFYKNISNHSITFSLNIKNNNNSLIYILDNLDKKKIKKYYPEPYKVYLENNSKSYPSNSNVLKFIFNNKYYFKYLKRIILNDNIYIKDLIYVYRDTPNDDDTVILTVKYNGKKKPLFENLKISLSKIFIIKNFDDLKKQYMKTNIKNKIDLDDYYINQDDFSFNIISNKDLRLIEDLELLSKVLLNLFISYLLSFIIINIFLKIKAKEVF